MQPNDIVELTETQRCVGVDTDETGCGVTHGATDMTAMEHERGAA